MSPVSMVPKGSPDSSSQSIQEVKGKSVPPLTPEIDYKGQLGMFEDRTEMSHTGETVIGTQPLTPLKNEIVQQNMKLQDSAPQIKVNNPYQPTQDKIQNSEMYIFLITELNNI